MGQAMIILKNCISCNLLNFSCHSDCCEDGGCFNCDYKKNNSDSETDLKICSIVYHSKSTVHPTNI